MTEAEWLESTDSDAILPVVRDGKNRRKLYLFAAASFSRLTHLLTYPEQLRAIIMLEQMGEEAAPPDGWRGARREVLANWRGSSHTGDHSIDDPPHVELMLYRALVSRDPAGHAETATRGILNAADLRTVQCRLLRDIFGNPFRPVAFDPRWRTADVVELARAIYEDRAFGRLPVLADALMDAGCADEQVLGHCRGAGPHVRGCWVVDLVLGKS